MLQHGSAGSKSLPFEEVRRWCNHLIGQRGDLSPPTCKPLATPTCGSLFINVRISLQHKSSQCRRSCILLRQAVWQGIYSPTCRGVEQQVPLSPSSFSICDSPSGCCGPSVNSFDLYSAALALLPAAVALLSAAVALYPAAVVLHPAAAALL